MNLPNLLSIFRLFITLFFVLAVHHNRYDIALYLFVIQGISDLLDGFIARVMQTKTDLGAFLDPLADKIMLVGAFVMLSVKGIVPIWLTCLVLLRDVVIAIGFFILYRLTYTTKPVPTILGKVTTACQIATILYALWLGIKTLTPGLPDTIIFVYVTALFTTLSGLHYVYVGIRLMNGEKVKEFPAGN